MKMLRIVLIHWLRKWILCGWLHPWFKVLFWIEKQGGYGQNCDNLQDEGN